MKPISIRRILGFVLSMYLIFGLVPVCSNTSFALENDTVPAENEAIYENEEESINGLDENSMEASDLKTGEKAVRGAAQNESSSKSEEGEMLENDVDGADEDNAVSFAGGDGSISDPYQIETAEQLNSIRNDLTANYVLNNDIVFSEADFSENGEFYNNGSGWAPIGANYSNSFLGSFDGKGHAIKGIKISITGYGQGTYRYGLFGASGGIIKNVGVEDIDYSFSTIYDGAWDCGGIVGYYYNDNAITGCYATGSIKFNGRSDVTGCYVGGIIGTGKKVTQSYNACSIYINGHTGSCAGGILGSGGGASNCFNTGSISAEKIDFYTGGICGKGSATSCYNMGRVMKRSISAGTIQYCYSYDKSAVATTIQQGTCLSGDEMKGANSFEGFDFNDVWQIGVNNNYPYPELKGVKNVVTDISTCDMVLSSETVSLPERPSIEVKQGSNILTNKRDYYMIYENYNIVGEGHILIYGLNDYVGFEDMAYNVGPYNLDNAYAMVIQPDGGGMPYNNNYSVKYNGSAQTLSSLRIYSRINRSAIPEDSYSISYEDNINVGTAKIIVTGDNITSTGTINLTFRIQPDADHQFQATDATFTYDGEPHTINISNPKNVGVVYSDSGTTGTFTSEPVYKTEIGTYYIYYYNNDRNYDYFTDYAVLTINPPETTITTHTSHIWTHVQIPAGFLHNGSEYDQCTVCKEKKNIKTLDGYATYYVKSFKVSKGKKAFTAKWKKQSKGNQKKFNGYQIRYSIQPDMSGAKYVTASKNSKSKKIKGLSKKTKYYIQVRTFTNTSAGTFYSSWSGVKTTKTK